jgi:lipopolysaccharide biosynthesis glycosyltransferase
MDKINVVFGSDRNYVPHLATAICSLIANNYQLELCIFIINSDIDAIQWRDILSVGSDIRHKFIDVKISEQDLKGVLVNQHFSKAIYYRLFAAEKISASKALYLDSDIVIARSICDLWNIDVDGYYLAAVEDPGFSNQGKLGMSPNAKYFNSGVMLLNLEAWRSADVKSRVLEFVKGNPEAIEYPDQCGMNAILNGEWLPLAPKYNTQSIFFELPETALSEIYGSNASIEAVNAPVVIHFSGATKPWQMNCRHRFKSEYWRYRNLTAYKSFVPDDFGFWSILKYFTPELVKRGAKAMLR